MSLTRLRLAAVANLLTLLALIVVCEIRVAPSHMGRLWLLATVAPLLLGLRGFLHGRRYTYQWMSLAVWLYFTAGIVRAWAETGPAACYGVLETVLATTLFGLCCAVARASAPSRSH